MIKPKQKLPYSKKNEQWKKNSFDYYSESCIRAIDKKKAQMLYRLATGTLEESDYTYITNPLNETDPKYKGYPAKIVNYDIISTPINTIIGDFVQRYFPPIVYNINSNFDNEQFDMWRTEVVKLLQKEFINKVIALGGPFEEEEIVNKLQDIEKKVRKVNDDIARNGQDSIEYIINYCEIVRKFRQLLYDYLVVGSCFSYKDVINDEVIYLTIGCMEISYLCSPQQEFIEDGEAARVVYKMSSNEAYDRLNGLKGFTEEVKKFLDEENDEYQEADASFYDSSDIDRPDHRLFNKLFGFYPNSNKSGVTIEHLTWRSFRKYAKVKFKDVFGNIQVIEQDEDYIPVAGEEIEWDWKDDIWEGYKVGGKFYVGIDRVPVTNAKLLYNGRNINTRYADYQSIVEKGEAYQKRYNSVSYTMELTLNKTLDKLIIFPLSLIPDKEGWNENTVMYYAKALSFLFVDDTKQNFVTAVNALKGVDLSLNKYIIEGHRILQEIKSQWYETCGMSPQRMGEISSNSLKSTAELGVQRSYIVNEIIYSEFEDFQLREYQGLLDLSQYAFIDGKKSTFTRRDGSIAILNIVNPEKYCNAKLGVFVKSGAKEVAKLNQIKGVAQAFAQNIENPALVSKIIDSENYTELKQYMDQISEELIQRAENARQQELGIQQQQIQSQLESQQRELDYKYYKTDADNLAKERIATIQTITSSLEALQPIVDNPNVLKTDENAAQLYKDRQLAVRDAFLKLKDIEIKEEQLKLKEKEIQSKERIAKHKDTTMLKNKVSGEK